VKLKSREKLFPGNYLPNLTAQPLLNEMNTNNGLSNLNTLSMDYVNNLLSCNVTTSQQQQMLMMVMINMNLKMLFNIENYNIEIKKRVNSNKPYLLLMKIFYENLKLYLVVKKN
jgi:hypothetical protein